jgi:Rrf2 family protein
MGSTSGIRVPFRYSSKARLLRTIPGPKGGIMLARDPETIPILSIVEAVEGKINLMECLEHPEQCGVFQACSIMSVLHGAQTAMVQALANTNLKLMVRTKQDPFNRLPEKHFQKPQFGCPVLK